MPRDIAILNALDRLGSAAKRAEPQAVVLACRSLQRAMADLADLPLQRRDMLASLCAQQISQAGVALNALHKEAVAPHHVQRAYAATSQVGQ